MITLILEELFIILNLKLNLQVSTEIEKFNIARCNIKISQQQIQTCLSSLDGELVKSIRVEWSKK